jgi:hypothetical protein
MPTGSPGSSTGTPESGAGGASGSGSEVLAIRVTGRTVDPAPTRVSVRVGERVTLRVSADRMAELHVHGVELERRVVPGKPTVVQFRLEEPGVFDVELHDPELLLVRLVAR